MNDIWVGSEEGDEQRSEVWIFLRELERQCGKDELEIAAILKSS